MPTGIAEFDRSPLIGVRTRARSGSDGMRDGGDSGEGNGDPAREVSPSPTVVTPIVTVECV